MTDEVAAMPQAMLRDVVLRLVCPETELPIPDGLRSAASRRLNTSNEAIDILRRAKAEPALLDEIAGLFLDVAEEPLVLATRPDKHTLASLVYPEILYAYSIAVLGASRPTLERTIVQLVRGGWPKQAEKLADRLGRNLTRTEISTLIETYIEGGVRGYSSDRYWPEFAQRHCGLEAARSARKLIAERNARWANDLY